MTVKIGNIELAKLIDKPTFFPPENFILTLYINNKINSKAVKQ